jgi:endonuclease/exonuclease/phosphatase family metal-dependent hydrolase
MSETTSHMSKALVLAGMLISVVGFAQEFGVMTYNIRYEEPRDAGNSWSNRKEAVVDLILKHEPVFLGTQEGLYHQITYLDSTLTNHTYIGVGRDDGDQMGEYCALFYDTTRFSMLEQHTFWLSETPEQVSYGWDSKFHRICTYGLFEDKETNYKIWVFNTHFDHVATEARKNSAHLITQRISDALAATRAPLILLGDFNATPDQEPILLIAQSVSDALTLSADPLKGPHGTFTGFTPDALAERRIDYIFVHDLEVLRYFHLDDIRPDGGYISDHLPVLARLRR